MVPPTQHVRNVGRGFLTAPAEARRRKLVLLNRLDRTINFLNVQLGAEVLCGIYFPPRSRHDRGDNGSGGAGGVKVMRTSHLKDLSQQIGFSEALEKAVFYSKLKRATQQDAACADSPQGLRFVQQDRPFRDRVLHRMVDAVLENRKGRYPYGHGNGPVPAQVLAAKPWWPREVPWKRVSKLSAAQQEALFEAIASNEEDLMVGLQLCHSLAEEELALAEKLVLAAKRASRGGFRYILASWPTWFTCGW
jgi:hypothetical protein